jgi:hypothetical protein
MESKFKNSIAVQESLDRENGLETSEPYGINEEDDGNRSENAYIDAKKKIQDKNIRHLKMKRKLKELKNLHAALKEANNENKRPQSANIK